MARKPRIHFPNAIYHVSARGNNKENIFLEDSDRELFIELMSESAARYNLHYFAFCLMDDHYHLLLRTPEANLSPAMQWLNSTYTAKFNRAHDRSGHLMQGRYKAVLVVDDSHLLHLSMYIHNNPVRADIVKDPALYPWSSFREYTRPESRFPWLINSELLAHYGYTDALRMKKYRKECVAISGKRPALFQQLSSMMVLGSREKLEQLARKLKPESQEEALKAIALGARPEVNVDRELNRVAEVFGVSGKDLRRRRRDFPPKFAAYYHLVHNRGMSVSKAAEAMNVTTSSISHGISKLKGLMSEDAELKAKVESLTAALDAVE